MANGNTRGLITFRGSLLDNAVPIGQIDGSDPGTFWSFRMLAFALLGVRVTKPVGEMAYIPGFADEALQTTFKKTKLGVLFFTNSAKDIDFAAFGVREYKNKITFIRAEESQAQKLGLNFPNFPAVVPFSKGKVIEIEAPEHKAAPFVNWLNLVLDPSSATVKSTEELRLLLEGKEPKLFGIDLKSVPSGLPKATTLHMAPKTYFEYFGIPVQEGLYIYRPIDRQIVPFNKSKTVQEQIKTPIVVQGSAEFYSKDFIGGYALNKTDDELCEAQHKALDHLATKFGAHVSFAMLDGDVLETIQKATNLQTAPPPFFVMVPRDNMSAGRWFITNPKLLADTQYLDGFVQKVIAGEQERSVYSEEDPNEPETVKFRKTTYNKFSKDIVESEDASFVVFTASWCPHCKNFKPVLREVANLLAETPAKFFWMDGGLNDWPENVPEIDGYPTAFLYPKGKKQEPLKYDGKRKLDDVIDFVKENAGQEIIVPEHNATEIEKMIHDELYPKPVNTTASETPAQ